VPLPPRQAERSDHHKGSTACSRPWQGQALDQRIIAATKGILSTNREHAEPQRSLSSHFGVAARSRQQFARQKIQDSGLFDGTDQHKQANEENVSLDLV